MLKNEQFLDRIKEKAIRLSKIALLSNEITQEVYDNIISSIPNITVEGMSSKVQEYITMNLLKKLLERKDYSFSKFLDDIRILLNLPAEELLENPEKIKQIFQMDAISSEIN